MRAAVAIADAQGIEGLTMRSLGRSLGVEAMSLYNHVSGKEDLLDGMVDIVFSEVDLDCGEGDWMVAMRRRALSALEALDRHRWAIGLMESRKNPGAATLRHHDLVLQCLRRGGFSVQMAAHAYSAIDSYVYGFALQRATLPFDSGDAAADMAVSMLAAFPSGEYPSLVEFVRDHVMKPGYSYVAEFEYGLDLILEGLARSVRQARRPVRRREQTPTRPPRTGR